MNKLTEYIKHCRDTLSDLCREMPLPELHVSAAVYSQASGSSIVHLNDTIVSCGLSIKIHINDKINPNVNLNKGILVCNVDLCRLSTRGLLPSQIGEESQALTERLSMLLSNNGPDLERFVIKENKSVYVLHLDLIVLNNSGNLLDACLLAANTVLLSAQIPKVVWNNELDNPICEEDNLFPMPIKPLVFSITFALINDRFVLNLDDQIKPYVDNNVEYVTLLVNENEEVVSIPFICGCLDEGKRNLMKDLLNQSIDRMKFLKNSVLNAVK